MPGACTLGEGEVGDAPRNAPPPRGASELPGGVSLAGPVGRRCLRTLHRGAQDERMTELSVWGKLPPQPGLQGAAAGGLTLFWFFCDALSDALVTL